jgi:hypothetical protein
LGFNKVHTIELQDYLYVESCNNLKDLIDNNTVEIHKGDSGVILPKILKGIDKPCTILLDAHIDGGNYKNGVTPNIRKCPLYDELNSIRNHHIKNHTILIDDVRILGKITHPWGKEVMIDKIIRMLKDINEDYIITYDDGIEKNDVLIAKI